MLVLGSAVVFSLSLSTILITHPTFARAEKCGTDQDHELIYRILHTVDTVRMQLQAVTVCNRAQDQDKARGTE